MQFIAYLMKNLSGKLNSTVLAATEKRNGSENRTGESEDEFVEWKKVVTTYRVSPSTVQVDMIYCG